MLLLLLAALVTGSGWRRSSAVRVTKLKAIVQGGILVGEVDKICVTKVDVDAPTIVRVVNTPMLMSGAKYEAVAHPTKQPLKLYNPWNQQVRSSWQ